MLFQLTISIMEVIYFMNETVNFATMCRRTECVMVYFERIETKMTCNWLYNTINEMVKDKINNNE